MELKETFVSRQEIFHGRIVDLRVDTVRLPNGHLTTREVIDHPGGVAVVAIDENDNVLTVKQYRYAFQTVLEEIPAGKLERGEDPAAAARRELSEETGASCETLTPLGEILASPGGFTEVLHLYMATGLTFGSQHRMRMSSSTSSASPSMRCSTAVSPATSATARRSRAC